MRYLDRLLRDGVISHRSIRGRDWSARSPDLNPLDFCARGCSSLKRTLQNQGHLKSLEEHHKGSRSAWPGHAKQSNFGCESTLPEMHFCQWRVFRMSITNVMQHLNIVGRWLPVWLGVMFFVVQLVMNEIYHEKLRPWRFQICICFLYALSIDCINRYTMSRFVNHTFLGTPCRWNENWSLCRNTYMKAVVSVPARRCAFLSFEYYIQRITSRQTIYVLSLI